MNWPDDYIGRVVCADALEALRQIPDNRINCCITSPPYWGLRDYGVAGQLGLEETLDEYIASLVGVFAEVRRVLRDDGTLWLNLGDSYTSGNRPVRDKSLKSDGSSLKSLTNRTAGMARPQTPLGLKSKELVGIPWRVAFALQADGWYLRSDIIWAKPNPLPESVTDRPTKSHEYLFLLAKAPVYYYDHEAIKEPAVKGWSDSAFSTGKTGIHQQGRAQQNRTITEKGLRNKRTVWTIPPAPYKGAHFATFPEKLVEPCLLAGCPEGGIILDPFAGSGTAGKRAKELGRRFVLIELNPEYCKLARDRLSQGELL